MTHRFQIKDSYKLFKPFIILNQITPSDLFIYMTQKYCKTNFTIYIIKVLEL